MKLSNEEFGIDIIPSSNFVESMNTYAVPSFNAMDVLDSTYCDTIYAITQGVGSSPIKDIPVVFELQEEDEVYTAQFGKYFKGLDTQAGNPFDI